MRPPGREPDVRGERARGHVRARLSVLSYEREGEGARLASSGTDFPFEEMWNLRQKSGEIECKSEPWANRFTLQPPPHLCSFIQIFQCNTRRQAVSKYHSQTFLPAIT